MSRVLSLVTVALVMAAAMSAMAMPAFATAARTALGARVGYSPLR